MTLLNRLASPAYAISRSFFKHANRFNVPFIETAQSCLSCQTKYGAIKIAVTNRLTNYRARTFLTKEVETIEWIDSFKEDDVYFDVGANIGLYSLYAGRKGVRVFSFEPESQNYALLNRNIYLNHLSKTVKALNIGLSDKEEIVDLYISRFEQGSALHSVAESIDLNHNSFEADFEQHVFSTSLDHLVHKFNLPLPNHLKIDVDGLESKIISGAASILKEPTLRSVLIELNLKLEGDRNILDILNQAGFEVVKKVAHESSQDDRFDQLFNFVFKRP